MASVDELTKRLEALAAQSEQRRLQRVESRSREMKDLNDRLDRFELLVTRWLVHDVVPRLRASASILPPENPPRVGTRSLSAFLERDSDEEFPASLEVRVQFAHDAAVDRAELRFQVRIIPILMKYEEEATLSLEIDESETSRLIEFIEDRVCQFIADFLKIREPESRYQSRQLVTDPVCGMAFHFREAEATLLYNRRKFHFCSVACRERFEADPGRYGA